MATTQGSPAKVGPVVDRVVVRSLETTEPTRGGLFIPETAKEKPQEGEIVAVGRAASTKASGFPLASRSAMCDSTSRRRRRRSNDSGRPTWRRRGGVAAKPPVAIVPNGKGGMVSPVLAIGGRSHRRELARKNLPVDLQPNDEKNTAMRPLLMK
jgi:hypothetical protein